MSDSPDSTPPPEIPPPVTPEPTLEVPVTADSPKTETGLSPGAAAGLAMLFLLVGGIVFYVLEKKNSLIRFYSLQSIALGAVAIAVNILSLIASAVLALIPILGHIILFCFGLVLFAFGIVFLVVYMIAVIKAFIGVEWEIPWLGKRVREFEKTGKLPFVS